MDKGDVISRICKSYKVKNLYELDDDKLDNVWGHLLDEVSTIRNYHQPFDSSYYTKGYEEVMKLVERIQAEKTVTVKRKYIKNFCNLYIDFSGDSVYVVTQFVVPRRYNKKAIAKVVTNHLIENHYKEAVINGLKEYYGVTEIYPDELKDEALEYYRKRVN